MFTESAFDTTPNFLNYRKRVLAIRCRPKIRRHLRPFLTDRQTRIDWWLQEEIEKARFAMVGNGGLGSRIGEMATRMGLAGHYVDHDLVDITNLNRQGFTLQDVGQPKPHCLVRNLQALAPRSMTLKGYWMTFQDFARTYARRSKYDVICCGVDNDEANIAAARYGLEIDRPVVFVNVSGDGDACRVFVQRLGEACFVCYKPQSLAKPKKDETEAQEGCPPTPAVADILSVANGLALRAVVSEILGVPMGSYNCRDFTFSGLDVARTVKRRNCCALCCDEASSQ